MRRLVALAFLTGLLSACGDASPPARGAPRLVSLGPHLTELVYSAGAGEHLVGAIAYSDYPPAAAEVPRIGDAFAVDLERLTALAPTHVLAWVGGNPDALLADLRTRGFNLVAFETSDLSSVATHVRLLGALAGDPQVADAAAAQFEVGLARLRARYADARPVRVFVQVGREPLYTVSGATVTGQLISVCGGRNVFAGLDTPAAAVSIESVVAADPDVILATGDDDAFVRWRELGVRAARTGQLYSIDPDLTSRASLRLLKGAQSVCAALATARRMP